MKGSDEGNRKNNKKNSIFDGFKKFISPIRIRKSYSKSSSSEKQSTDYESVESEPTLTKKTDSKTSISSTNSSQFISNNQINPLSEKKEIEQPQSIIKIKNPLYNSNISYVPYKDSSTHVASSIPIDSKKNIKNLDTKPHGSVQLNDTAILMKLIKYKRTGIFEKNKNKIPPSFKPKKSSKVPMTLKFPKIVLADIAEASDTSLKSSPSSFKKCENLPHDTLSNYEVLSQQPKIESPKNKPLIEEFKLNSDNNTIDSIKSINRDDVIIPSIDLQQTFQDTPTPVTVKKKSKNKLNLGLVLQPLEEPNDEKKSNKIIEKKVTKPPINQHKEFYYPQVDDNKPKITPETIKICYGSKKIMLPNGKYYIFSKPYYCNPSLYNTRHEIYKKNLEMKKIGQEYEIVFSKDGIEFPYYEIDKKEELTIEEEAKLIIKYASATNDIEAREALGDMWKQQMFCDLVIATEKKKYLAHQIIFCHYSDKLRESFLIKKDFIAKIEVSEPNDEALQQLLSFIYLHKIPTIRNFKSFYNLMKCALQFEIKVLIEHLLTYPDDLRRIPEDFCLEGVTELPYNTLIVIENLSKLFPYLPALLFPTDESYYSNTPPVSFNTLKETIEKNLYRENENEQLPKLTSTIIEQAQENNNDDRKEFAKKPLLCSFKMNANLLLNTNVGNFKVSTGSDK